MKIKDDIILWKEECSKLNKQVQEFDKNSEQTRAEVKELTSQVQKLTAICEQMANAMLALIRQQLGD